MLLHIRDFIRHQGVVSTQQLTREFHLELPALQPMLDMWVAKGVIRQCQEKANCQSACYKCRVRSFDYYQLNC